MFEMKKLYMFFVVAFTAAMFFGCASQNQASNQSKMMRTVRKEVRHYVKNGWRSSSDPPLEYQLVRAYEMANELDENGNEKYVFGEACAIGNDFFKTYSLAIDLAKITLVSKIETEYLESLRESFSIRFEFAPCCTQMYDSLVECVVASRDLMTRYISIEPLLMMYRELSDTQMEVRVMVFAEYDYAKEEFVKVVNGEKRREEKEYVKKLKEFLDKEFLGTEEK